MSLNSCLNTLMEVERMNCHDAILDAFEDWNGPSRDKDDRSWQFRYLITLMRAAREEPTERSVKNCLLLLLNLFMVDKPDRYHVQGKPMKALDEEEKRLVKALLRSCW
jgi:hypothetical protein